MAATSRKHRPSSPKAYGGRTYRSGFEAQVAQDLSERAVPFHYERDRYEFEVPGMYVCDFTLPLGVVVECKGYMDRFARRKLLRVKERYPDLDLRLLFQNAKTRINCKLPSSMNYGQWATRHGFLWAEGKIPESWVLASEMEL